MPTTSHPTQLAQYEIRALLASGQTWRVYEGFDTHSGRAAALKVISKQLLNSFPGDMAARFRTEARAASSLNHPGIVNVYEYGEDAQLAFIAMEYVKGWHLRERFRVPANDAVNLMVQVLNALDYAHEKGVVHGEINPSNLLLTRDGHLRVANFGVVRLGTGSPNYLAPEQFMGVELDCRCDIFSCGVMFYELLTGVSPFPGPPQQIANRVCNEKEKPPSSVNSSVPPAFDRVCARALTKSPSERYAKANIFLDDVRRANLESAVGSSLSPVVSNDTIIAHASFKPPAGSPGVPAAGESEASAPPLSRSPVVPLRPGPVSLRSLPSVIPAAAEKAKPAFVEAVKPVSSPKSLPPDLAARLEELMGKSPNSLAGYLEDIPSRPERVINAFLATVQALIAGGPANCKSESLAPQSIRFDPLGRATLPSAQNQAKSGTAASPRYAAPEMISEMASAAEPNSAATQVYALGMMFYEILLGKQLFEKIFSNQRSDLGWLRWQADIESKAPPLKSWLPDCPAALSDLIESMMEKNVNKRQVDANVIASQLRDIARRSNKTVVLRTPAASVKVEPKQVPAVTKKNALPTPLIFLILVVAIGAVLFTVWQKPEFYQGLVSQCGELVNRVWHVITGR